MGLDITAYERVLRIGGVPEDDVGDGAWGRGNIVLYVNRDFPEQADQITHGEYRPEGERFAFRAGSYGGYNSWRNLLCRMANGMSADEFWDTPVGNRPFEPLINFSDCEGVIGPDTSALLAQTFAQYQHAAEAFAAKTADGEYWLQKYNQWRKAFEIASHGGCVDFH